MQREAELEMTKPLALGLPPIRKKLLKLAIVRLFVHGEFCSAQCKARPQKIRGRKKNSPGRSTFVLFLWVDAKRADPSDGIHSHFP